ncbi:MAG TPA: BON domain-containing protein [Anaerolineaceae bacterium]|nr:BON domain-containing protein [Anaerolineaceae bacterium]
MKTDIELRNDILDELQWEPSVTATEIGVIVEDSIVTLTGTVQSFPEKWGAEKAALRVSGVKGVANEIDVELPSESRRSDEDIARAAANALDWDVVLPKDLQVVVENGWVTLNGTVEWQYQKTAAQNDVARLTGVKGVINNTKIKSKVSTNAVQGKIESALQRLASLDAKEIRVKTDGGKVTLEGTVASWEEKEAAEDAAWSAPGVTDVDDKLVIL